MQLCASRESALAPRPPLAEPGGPFCLLLAEEVSDDRQENSRILTGKLVGEAFALRIDGAPVGEGETTVAGNQLCLRLTGSSVEKSVLDQMDAIAPEVAESVRNLMFVFADIVKLTDRDIQVLLREVDQKDLCVALKAASEELKTKILSNISEQARTSITEEMEFLGPMRLTEVEAVQLRIVQQVRQLEEQGKLTVVRGAVSAN